MTIEELLKEYNGMVEFGFKGIELPDNDWRREYVFRDDWDLDRFVICSIILLLKKHMEYKCILFDINDLFLIHDNGVYLKVSCWEFGDFIKISGNINGIALIMEDIKEFLPGSNMSYLIDGIMGVEL
jgi:hypothetical protein